MKKANKTTKSKKSGGKKGGKYLVMGYGSGGIDEMGKMTSDDHACFGVTQISIGSGSFERTKLIFLDFSAEQASPMQRSKLATSMSKIKTQIGSTHATYTAHLQSEVNIEAVMEDVGHLFASDDGEFDAGALIKEYRSRIASQSGKKKSKKRKTAKDMKDSVSAEMALKMVHDRLGPFNWALFKINPKTLTLINAGGNSIMEMVDSLEDDSMACGLLRMGFGSGTFRRTKWIGIWWIGSKVSRINAGKANTKQGAMNNLIRPFTFQETRDNKDELEASVFLESIKPKLVIDDLGGKDSEQDPFTMEQFLKALEEEQNANKQFFGDEGDNKESVSQDFEDILSRVRGNGDLNWALFDLPKKRR